MPETSKMQPIGALFSDTWRTYKEQFAVLIKIALVPALFLAIGSIAAGRGFAAAIFGSLFSIAGWVLTILASIAIVIALEHKTGFDESYRRSTPLFWPYLWISILTGLATLGGFVMLVVPGIILAIALSFSRYLIILENRRGLDALTQSRAYVKGYWWAILGRGLLLGLCYGAALLVIYLPAILIFGKVFGAFVYGILYGILALLFAPFSLVYIYEIYKNLASLKPEVRSSQATEGKTFLTVSAIVGVVAPIVFTILAITLFAVFVGPYMKNNPALLQQMQYPVVSTTTSTSSPAGMHCGGFIRNAPTCPSGYHCQLNLRYPDTGGVCVVN